MSGTLFLVPVPIGNAQDVTLRALEVLRRVALVAAEDTRHFQTLQRRYDLRARVLSLHEHNEAARVPEVIARLHDGADVGLVSDAGTPLLSDPGYRLVSAAIADGIAVTSLPGASAITTALAASGLPPVPFRFCGFPPRTAAARRAFYAALARDEATLVCFEAPHRLRDSLRDACDALGDREACLARNLTKPHERFQRGPLSRLVADLGAEDPVRGECTVVIGGAPDAPGRASLASEGPAKEVAAQLRAQGVPSRAIVATLTTAFGLPRRRAYELAHRPGSQDR